ncbi:MAG TPA: hypothetical protein VIJ65_02425, partial [Acidobacteriaceae bacterium]
MKYMRWTVPATERSLFVLRDFSGTAREKQAAPVGAWRSASAAPPCGFGFQKIFCATSAKRFSEPSEKAPLGTWERGTSRRFAQECPEGIPGK